MISDYKKEIHNQMLELAKWKHTIFLGQQVWPQNFYGTLEGISEERRIELPVAEEMQLGMSLGMSLERYLPISIFQRIDFLCRACDQLVNHLDLVCELSQGKFNPKVIIRTTLGSNSPLNTGLQHNKDLILGFSKLLRNIKVFRPETPKEVKAMYEFARVCKHSVLIVEDQNLYEC